MRDNPDKDPFLDDLMAQVRSAEAKFRPYNSFHEAYAVLLEEVDEFWAEVKMKREQRDYPRLRAELLDIMCVCYRIARSLGLEELP